MEGYVFVSWRYNGEEISVDPEISIVVGGETKGTYTAYYEPIVYSIKKETSSNGTFYISHSPNVGNEDGTNSGIINDTVYLNVVPVEGYELSKAYYIVEGDIKQHLITDNKFTMPAGNVKIFVEFKLKEYNIEKVSENGSFIVSGKTTMGEKITIEPVANIGYEFDNAYYINANDGKKYTIKDNSFVMPASDITIYVEFKFIDYVITSGASANGTFTVSGTPNIGQTITINPQPSAGYKFARAYYVESGSEDKKYITGTTFTMPANNITVYVEFVAIDYTIIKGSTKNGSFTYSGTPTIGQEITISNVTPIEGYTVEKVYYKVNGTGAEIQINDNRFTMPANNVTIGVHFVAIDYTISKAPTTNGEFIVQSTGNVGKTITITPQPSAGYQFSKAYYVKSGTDERIAITGTTFKMPASNITVYAEFVAIDYTIIKGSTKNGSFTYSGTPNIGQTITISDITPIEGYKVGKVYYKVNGTGAEIQINDNSFVMPANNVTIGIHFVAIDYTISKAPTTNGDFLFSGTPNVGQTIIITPQPNTGFSVDSVVVTAENKGGIDVVNNGETYTFKMPADNVTINVSFVNIVYNITKNDSQNGSYTIEGNKASAIYGEEIKLNITPELGFKVSAAYFVDSQNKRTELDISDIESGNLTFTMPANNISIFVEFIAIDYEIKINSDGCEVEVDNFAKYKSIVNFLISPKVGFKVENIKVLNSLNQEIEVTNINANNYSFTMPADNVTIVVSVEQFIFAYASDDTLGSVEVSGGNQIGDEVTLTFNFAEGKAGEFIGWTEDDAKGWAQNSSLNLLKQDVNNPLQYKYVLESFEPKAFYAVCNPVQSVGTYRVKGKYSKIYYDARDSGAASISYCDISSLVIPIAAKIISTNKYDIINIVRNDTSSLDRPNLKNVILPESITSIEKYAFKDCTGLTSIIIPSSVKHISSYAFSGCSSLKSITLPFVGADRDGTSYTYFGYIFGEDSYPYNNLHVPNSLKEVIILEGFTNLRAGAFKDCTSITNITLPNSVTSIGNSAFNGCSSLLNVNIPNGVTSIGNSAFCGCSNLTSVNIPKSITTIEHFTFYECSSLKSINIPSSVTSIGSYAFRGCTGLTSITIPSNVTSIGNFAFQECANLNSIIFEETNDWSVEYWASSDIDTISSEDLSNPETAASYLTDKYCSCEWMK